MRPVPPGEIQQMPSDDIDQTQMALTLLRSARPLASVLKAMHARSIASLQLSGFALPRFPLTNLAPIPQSAESALPVESGLSIANSPLFAIIGDQPDVVESYELESMVKRRRKKMHRHKYRKRLRKERNLEK